MKEHSGEHKMVGLKENTKIMLDELKLCKQESYDNVINRLIEGDNI